MMVDRNIVAESPFDALWRLGYRNLVPIIPPGAPLSERSGMAKRLAAGDDARGKAPGVRGRDGSWSGFDWIPYEADEHDLRRWAASGAGVGIKTGLDGLALIDADTLDERLAAVIERAIEQHLGVLPVRVGRYPKAGYVCRVEGEFRYSRIEFGARDERGRLKERVEILAHGRQFVAAGTHPVTGKPYHWPRGLPPYVDLPTVPAAALTALLEALRPLLPAASEIVQEGAKTEVAQESLRGDPQLVAKAVRATPNTSDRFPTREAYLGFGYAIKAALPDDPDLAHSLFADWCARWDAPDGNDPRQVEADWRRMKPPFRRGAGWLYEVAEDASGGAFSAAERWFQEISTEPPLFPEIYPNALKSPVETMAARVAATPYTPGDAASIPPRAWLYGRHLIRRFVSATVAPSGVGKSSLIIAEALAMASGKPLLGAPCPAGPLRVWLWNGEDPREELERRILACMQLHGLTPADIGDRLYLDSGRQLEIILAVQARDGATIHEPVAAAVESVIQAQRIDVMQVDPFVSSHRVSENDNGAIDAVAKRWARIADRTGAGIELVHHVRKTGGAEITVEDSRGAGALVAATRSARALTRMTRKEGERAGLVAAYRRLFRFSDAKQNLSPPAAGDAVEWFELASVPLGNGAGSTPVEREMSGDQVGAVRRFAGGVPVHALETSEESAALEELASGEWRRDVRAGDAWAGVPIGRAMGLDLDDAADVARAKLALRDMIAAGRLREVSRPDKARRMRTFVEVVVPVAGVEVVATGRGGVFG
jgi:hypothetical protein